MNVEDVAELYDLDKRTDLMYFEVEQDVRVFEKMAGCPAEIDG